MSYSDQASRFARLRAGPLSLINGGPAWLTLAPFGVYCFVYPFAILLMSFDWMPFGMEWMSSLLLAMLGLTCLGWLWANMGRIGLVLGVLLFCFGIGLEYLGVLTGFPFGTYRYTGVLVPELPGGVPLAIGFAWLLVIVSGYFSVQRYLAATISGRAVWLWPISGAALAVVLDLLLEPVAYRIKGYWQWIPGDGAYYGIPLTNFAAWFIAAAVFGLPFAFLWRQRAAYLPWLPVTLFVMNVLMFGIVDVAHGFLLAGVIGLAALLVVFFLSRKRVK